eukprot:5730354-Alexandrium_andersonii.AAC.1
MVKKVPGTSNFLINHFHTGPKNNQKLSKASYIQFVDVQDRNHFLTAAGGKGTRFEVLGHTLTMKPSKSAINMSRDWALRKATEMLKNEVSDGST